jgi:hypothetical protein
LILPNQKVEDRARLLIFSNEEFLSSSVNNQRRTSIDSPFKTILTNKVTVLVDAFATNFIEAFSTPVLFNHGEAAKSKFAAWGHGWFYLPDFVLIILGFIYIGKNKKLTKLSYGFIAFILIATIPALVNNGSWNLLRMFWSNILLILFISFGWLEIKSNKFIFVFGIVIYCAMILRFGYYYYFRYPILGNNTSYLAERVVIGYIERLRQNSQTIPITVYTVDPPVMTWSYIVYGTYYSAQSKIEFAKALNSDDVVVNNITFTGKCVDINRPGILIAESSVGKCDSQNIVLLTKVEEDKITIPSIVDNGAYFRVYNDELCMHHTAGQFVNITSINDFNFASQTNEIFCTTWFSMVD